MPFFTAFREEREQEELTQQCGRPLLWGQPSAGLSITAHPTLPSLLASQAIHKVQEETLGNVYITTHENAYKKVFSKVICTLPGTAKRENIIFRNRIQKKKKKDVRMLRIVVETKMLLFVCPCVSLIPPTDLPTRYSFFF